jgi:hypothetical protein
MFTPVNCYAFPVSTLSRWRVLIEFLWTILLSICRGHGDLTAGPSWLGVRVRPSCDDQDTGCQMIRSRWTKWCGGGGGYYSQETSPLFLIFFLHPPERECGGGCNKWRILKKLLPQKKKRRKKTRDWEIGNPSMWRSNIYINIALTNRFSLMKDFFLLVSLFPPRLFLASRCIRHDRAVIDQQFLSLLVP